MRSRPARSTPTRFLGVLCGIAAVIAGSGLVLPTCSEPASPPVVAVPGGRGSGLVATVARVVDGDTLELSFAGRPRERARLLGIDTPETVKPDAPVECYGPEASELTHRLLTDGTEVIVQRDEEPRDRYGRLLVYLWRRSDGLFVNRQLLAEGGATVLSIDPNTARRAELAAAEREARSSRAGLWGACPPPNGG